MRFLGMALAAGIHYVQNSTEKGISLIYETQTEDGLFNGLRLIEKQYEYREN